MSPSAPPLGEHDEQTAAGEPSERTYLGSRDGDYRLWEARQAERIAIAREAQQAWEEKARAEAQAWAKREAGGKAGEGEGDESPPGA